jgi:parallel beta-helix repeat protein
VGVDLGGGQKGSSANRLAGNSVLANHGIGILVHEGADRNVLVANRARGNLGTHADEGGIVVTEATGNALTGNLAARGAGVGIGVLRSTGNRLAGNLASGNRRGGIEAAKGTVDGGGNRASGNTGGPQCTGVAC